MGLWAGKTIECCEQSLMIILVGALKIDILRELWIMEAQLMRFQKGTRTAPGTGLRVIHVRFWPKIWL